MVHCTKPDPPLLCVYSPGFILDGAKEMVPYQIVLMWAAKFWQIILHGSHIAMCAALVLDYLLQGCCVAKGLGGQRSCLQLEQRAGLFTVRCNEKNGFFQAEVGPLQLRGLQL